MNLKILSFCVFTITMWSSAFVGVQVVMKSLRAEHFISYRLTVSALVLFLIFAFTKTKAIPWGDQPKVALSGIFGSTLYCLFLSWAQSTATSAESCLIINTMPLFAAVLSWVFYKRRLSSFAMAGLALGFTGITIMVWPQLSGHSVHHQMAHGGTAFLLLAALAMAFSTVIQKKLLEKHHPLAVIGTGIAYGSLVSWPFGYDLFTVMDTWSMETHALVLYLAIFPSALAYLSWGVILQKVETHRATNLMYLIPFGTIFLEVLLLNESASAMAYIGGGVAFLGVVVAQISKTNNEPCLTADT